MDTTLTLCKTSGFLKDTLKSIIMCFQNFFFSNIGTTSQSKFCTSFNGLLRDCTYYFIFLENMLKFHFLICVEVVGNMHVEGWRTIRLGGKFLYAPSCLAGPIFQWFTCLL